MQRGLLTLAALALAGGCSGNRALTDSECHRFADRARECGDDVQGRMIDQWCARNVGEDFVPSGIDSASERLADCDQVNAAYDSLMASRAH